VTTYNEDGGRELVVYTQQVAYRVTDHYAADGLDVPDHLLNDVRMERCQRPSG
jgi:hypothetical protein